MANEEIWIKSDEELKIIDAKMIIDLLNGKKIKWLFIKDLIVQYTESGKLERKKKFKLNKGEFELFEKFLFDLPDKSSIVFLDNGITVSRKNEYYYLLKERNLDKSEFYFDTKKELIDFKIKKSGGRK